MTSANSYTALVKGKKVTFTYTGNATVPPFNLVTSVSVIPFTKEGNIVAVRLRHRGLDIPGGHVEPGETTPEETMNREVMEEACIITRNPVLVEVIESDFFEQPSYMLLYGAFADQLHEFTPHKDELSYERVVVSQKEFIEKYEAGDKRLMQQAICAAWERVKDQESLPAVVPVFSLQLPQYQIAAEPDYKAIGKIVDEKLKKHFMGRTIAARGIGSSEHPGKTIDELVEIIKRTGTDRYNPNRTGDRYENIQNKHIDLFGFRRKVTPHMQLFKDVVYGFYHSAIGFHGKAVRIDILIIYDAAKLKSVVHQYAGRIDKKRDGFVFREPECKNEALLGIVKILS